MTANREVDLLPGFTSDRLDSKMWSGSLIA